jgi:hypothetical protein
MKIVKLFYIIALCSALNTYGIFRPSSLLKIRKQGIPSFKKILSEEERFFYRNQNELAMSQIRVNEKKESFHKEQAEFTKYKKYVFRIIVGTPLFMEIGGTALGMKDINGYPIYWPIQAILALPSALLTRLNYTNYDLSEKLYLKTKAYEEKIKQKELLSVESKK